jgi:hypothetical protein
MYVCASGFAWVYSGMESRAQAGRVLFRSNFDNRDGPQAVQVGLVNRGFNPLPLCGEIADSLNVVFQSVT